MLLDELLMYKRDSDNFRVVYRSSDTAYNLTGYIAIDYKLLGFKLSFVTLSHHVAFTCMWREDNQGLASWADYIQT